MPATAGRVRMPHNNRMSTSGALKTSQIWSKTIGHDPHGERDGESAGPQSGEAAAAAQLKAENVMQMARAQNLTDSANRDDFARRLYTGLKAGKKRSCRNDGLDDAEAQREQRDRLVQHLLQQHESSSEEELVEAVVVEKKRSAREKEKKKKRRKKYRHGHDNSDGSDSDSNSSVSSQEDERRKEKKRNGKKYKRRKRHYSSCSSHSDDSSSSGTELDRKRIERKKRRKKDKRRKDEKKERLEYQNDRSSGKGSDKPPREIGMPFVAASQFEGSRKGYVFKNGIHGVGYYEDKP